MILWQACTSNLKTLNNAENPARRVRPVGSLHASLSCISYCPWCSENLESFICLSRRDQPSVALLSARLPVFSVSTALLRSDCSSSHQERFSDSYTSVLPSVYPRRREERSWYVSQSHITFYDHVEIARGCLSHTISYFTEHQALLYEFKIMLSSYGPY